MAAKRYLAYIASRLTEVAGLIVSAGAADEGKLVALDAAGKLDASVMPAGMGVNTQAAVASENLAAGDLISFWDNAGTLNVRKADATAVGKECHGFVLAGFAASASATVYLPGNVLTGLTGLTPGARQYMSTTPGLRTETAPSAVGNVAQAVGIALGATSMALDPEEPITRA